MATLSACTSSSDVSTTVRHEPSPTSTVPATTQPVLSFESIEVDPLRVALADNRAAIFDYETLFPEELLSAREACETEAVRSTLSEAELSALGVAAPHGILDFDRLNKAQAGELAELLVDCPGTSAIVEALVRSTAHPFVAECLISKIADLNREADFVEQLADASVIATSVYRGFGFPCNEAVLEDAFGKHPGGTLGEDKRHTAQAIEVIWDMPLPQTDFEGTCRIRALMNLMPDAWFERLALKHSGSIWADQVDSFLREHSSTEEINQITETVETASAECQPPARVLVVAISRGLTDEQQRCLSFKTATSVLIEATESAESLEEYDELAQNVLERCG